MPLFLVSESACRRDRHSAPDCWETDLVSIKSKPRLPKDAVSVMFCLIFLKKHIFAVLNNRRLSNALLGVTKEEFTALLLTFEKVVLEHRASRKRERAIGGGSNGKIKSPKTYPTFDVAAFVFASSKSRTHRWAHDILPLLERTLGRKIVLPKWRIATPEEFFAAFTDVREVMIDGVERPTVRSQKDKTQRKHYSGKKKCHMRKNVVIADAKKRILALTPSKHGCVHDKKLADKVLAVVRPPEEVSVLADTGFIGIDKQHPNTPIPRKKPRGGVLTEAEKAMNRLSASSRMAVEHAIGGMKRFRAASDIFRNKNGWDDKLALVATGLWNFHLSMAR